MFYLKMAIRNVKNALGHYAPFMLASLLLYSLTCSTLLIMLAPMGKNLGTGVVVLLMGVVVLSIFSLIMERYSYKILLKQRSREFGLYNILGMNKAQVSWIATLELGIIFLGLVVLGTIFSAIFAKFLYVIFANIIDYHRLNLTLKPLPFVITILIFAVIFFFLELTALVTIRRTSPLHLFKQKEQGEKEPRGNVLLAFLGISAIGIAYASALTSSHLPALPLLLRFFVAVLLVIFGTYLFYISFMTWYLKFRRKNKAYYYQPEHFISTSQMIFRMKQNAVGLASISLLAVMALVTIGTTLSLYCNTQELVHHIFLKNTAITYTMEKDTSSSDIQAFKSNLLKSVGQSDKELIDYSSTRIAVAYDQKSSAIQVTPKNIIHIKANKLCYAYLLTQSDFGRIGNKNPHLKGNQVMVVSTEGTHLDTIDFLNQHYDVLKNSNSQVPELSSNVDAIAIVFSNQQQVDAVKSLYANNGFMSTTYNAYLDLTASQQEKVRAITKTNQAVGVQNRKELLAAAYQVFGAFLFAGFLLGISFILGIALIIYYKQYSEGYEDKKSYHILQEVGMSERQVKKTINSQIVIFFFMPLALATMHFIVALPVLRHFLLYFGVLDTKIVAIVSSLTILSVALIYFIVYRLTSRTYYRIIER